MQIEALVGHQPSWMARAACRTYPWHWFFSRSYSRQQEKRLPGLAICACCPVASCCLDYALANDEKDGIWGGLTTRQRRKLARASGLGTSE